jgi:predicted lysophospholipase L1 biosynthesis ABC-type transport system permease subunit
MRVVGSGYALRPLTGDRPWATGAVLTFAGLRRIEPAATYTEYRLRIEPSADRGAVLDRLERSIGLGRFEAPTKLANFGGLSGFPIAFSVLFALAGVAMLAHALLTSIRRRRRELALMMVLGFARGQIVASVAWQATTVAVIGLAVGLPLGTALARFGWNVFAADLAVLPRPVIPVWQLVVMVPATLLVANLVAALPGSLAARTKPASALRAE